MNLTYLSLAVDADMRGEQNDDIAVFWDVTAECAPACLTCKWEASEPCKREDLTPALLEE